MNNTSQYQAWKSVILAALAWAGLGCPLAAQPNSLVPVPAGPYSYADGTGPFGAPDSPIPGFVGVLGDGVSNFDASGNPINNGQTLNPAFVGWATDIAVYAPARPQLIDSAWKLNSGLNGTAPLGPPTGNVYEVVSLGDLGPLDLANNTPLGTITLSFAGGIADGQGPDFAVFGNAFVVSGSTLVFAKVAYVEVASDGTHFARFPLIDANPQPASNFWMTETDSNGQSFTGWPFAISDPTLMYNLAGKHENANGHSWGTPFDLAQLTNHPEVLSGNVDLNSIRYVRITEIPGSGDYPDDSGDPGNPIYAAWLATGSPGFELQAVGVLHGSSYVADNLTAQVAPSIGRQPVDTTVVTGQIAAFICSVSGEPPPSLRWERRVAGASTWAYLTEGSTYMGTTTGLLSVQHPTLEMSGDEFACVAINGAGLAASQAANLTVNPAAPFANGQSGNATAMAGQAANFTFSALGATSWQWQVSTDNGLHWSNLTNNATVSGATTATLKISNVTIGMTGQRYQCVATNVSGSVLSNPVALTVTSPVAFQKQPQPASQTVKFGTTVTYSALAKGVGSGNLTVKYQWQFNGVNIAKATTANLTLRGVKATASGNYTVVANITGLGTNTSSPAHLLVIQVVPKVTKQPTAVTAKAGATVTFSVTATGDVNAPLSYAWQKGSVNLAASAHVIGVNTSTLQLTDITKTNAASYRVVVTNLAGKATSVAAKLTVK